MEPILRMICRILCLMVLTASGCGPINNRPPGLSPAKDSPVENAAGITKSSKALFLMYFGVKDPNGKADPKLSPQLGSNTFQARLLRAENLKPVSKDAKVIVEYCPLHQEDSKTSALVTAQADGTYAIEINFKEAGKYELFFTVSDKDIEDTYVSQIQL